MRAIRIWWCETHKRTGNPTSCWWALHEAAYHVSTDIDDCRMVERLLIPFADALAGGSP